MYRVLVSLILALASFIPAKAAVVFFGGNLTYSHVGSGVYHIYLDVFLDCSGDTLSNDTLFLNRQGGYQGSILLLASARQKLWEKDITGLGDSCSVGSKCSSGSFGYGFKSVRYRYQVDLSADSACKFLAYWNQYTWSNSMTTGSANAEAILVAEIDRCTSDVSSPQFSIDPMILLMYKTDQSLSFAATDAQSDSMSYHLTPVLYIGGIPQGPFPYNRPLTFFGYPNTNLQWPAGFHLDPHSGLVRFRPFSLNQVAIISVEAKSWKRVNGTMQVVSKASRYQGVVIGAQDTTNASPYVSFLGSKQQGCFGDILNARYGLYDPDSTQHLRVIPVSTADGMTWNVDYTQSPPLLTIEWVPDSTAADVNGGYYPVEFFVEDNYCPLPKRYLRSTVFSVGKRPSADIQISDTSCGNISINIQNLENTIARSWYMDDGGNTGPTSISYLNPPRLRPGVHYSMFQLVGYHCNMEYYDTLDIASYAVPDLSVNPSTFCANTSHQFLSGVDSSFTDVDYTWTWQGKTYSDSLGTADLVMLDSGYLLLLVKDSIGCETWDSIRLYLHPEWTLETGLDTTLCSEDPYLLDVAMDSLKNYTWWDSTSSNSTYAPQSGTYWLEAVDTNGCSSRDSFNIILNPIPDPDLGPDAKMCHYDSVSLDAGAGFVFYSWSDGDSSQIRWVSGNANLQVFVEDQNGCVGSDTIQVAMYSPSQLNLGNDTLLCWTDSLLLDGGSFVSWLWNDSNTQQQRWVDQAGTYSVTATDINTCVTADTLVLSIHKPEVQISGDTLFCSGDSVELSILQTYPLVVWSTGDTADYTYVNASGMSYVFITDSLGCSNGAGYSVGEMPLPTANFTFSDLGGRMIQFNAADTTLMEFTWIFGDGDSSFIHDPLHTYPAYQNYQAELFVVDDYGCENSSTQIISFGTGISPAEEMELKIYPNPSNGRFFIDWQGPATEIRVVDQLGKQVAQIQVEQGARPYSLGLVPGVYMLMDAQASFEPVRIQVLP